MPKNIVLNPAQHTIHFDFKGCQDLTLCQGLCCKHWDINLALAEHQEGLYTSEAFCSLDKSLCDNPAKACYHRAWRLKKKKDGSCFYLDKNNRCSIYSTRPIVCRNFSCENGFKIEPVACVSAEFDDEAEICSFEGGMSLKSKFIFNPYLRLLRIEKNKNFYKLEFKDIISCKKKVVEIRGLPFNFNKKEAVALFSCFNGKNSLLSLVKKNKHKSTKECFLNLINYLVDEEVLQGVFG